ncbi:MAG: hypothetical protein KKC51_04200 [Verrucomicrobia bacterium]|nr:hypothetical protein [Verrucomicrobiota bacterium]
MKRTIILACAAAALWIQSPVLADEVQTVTWEEILQRLALTAEPGTELRQVVRPLIDRPARLEAVFDRTEKDEAGRTWQRFRYDHGNNTFMCFSDAESAPAAPGWRGAVTGLLVEFEFHSEDLQGHRFFVLRLRKGGTERLP